MQREPGMGFIPNYDAGHNYSALVPLSYLYSTGKGVPNVIQPFVDSAIADAEEEYGDSDEMYDALDQGDGYVNFDIYGIYYDEDNSKVDENTIVLVIEANDKDVAAVEFTFTDTVDLENKIDAEVAKLEAQYEASFKDDVNEADIRIGNTSKQRKADKDNEDAFRAELSRKGIKRGSKEAADLWKSGGYRDTQRKIMGKDKSVKEEYTPGDSWYDGIEDDFVDFIQNNPLDNLDSSTLRKLADTAEDINYHPESALLSAMSSLQGSRRGREIVSNVIELYKSLDFINEDSDESVNENKLSLVKILKETTMNNYESKFKKFLTEGEVSKEEVSESLPLKEDYNGWTNYATWRVALEVFDGMDEEQVREFADHESLEDYVEEILTMNGEEGLAVDFARAFLNDVNYREILQNMRDDHDISDEDEE